jgi:hypothetical protein
MYKKKLINDLEIIKINDKFTYSKLIKNNDIILIHYLHYIEIYKYLRSNIKRFIIHSTTSHDIKDKKILNENEYHYNEDNLIELSFKHNKYIKKLYLDALDSNISKKYNFDIFINFGSDRGPNNKDIFENLFLNIINNQTVFIYFENKDNYKYLYNYNNITIFNDYINMNEFDFHTFIYINYENSKINRPDNSCRNIIIMKYFKKNIIYLNPFNFKDGAYYRYLDDDIDKYKLTMNDEIIQLILQYIKY